MIDKISDFKLKTLFFIVLIVGVLSSFTASETKDGSILRGKETSSFLNHNLSARTVSQKDEKLETKLNEFRAFLNENMKKWQVPGIGVGIVKEGRVVMAEGFGLRNMEKNLPATAETLFAIGSSSKAFTTMDIGILVDEGMLEWDKPVRTYLPEFRLKDEIATSRMTVRDLVSHRSGLPRHDAIWYGTSFSRKEIFDRLQHLDFSADFREIFQYNNLMFLTAGYLVGRITDSTWEEFTQKKIFEPLGMSNSNFSVEDSEKSDNHSLPYVKKEDKIEAVPFRNVDNVGPAGSINSTVNDMLKWIRFHLNKGKAGDIQVISEAGLKEMYTPTMAMREPLLSLQPDGQSEMNYGLGWFLETYRGHRLVHHGGAIDGFYSLVVFLPNADLGAVILANLSGTPLLYIAMGYILDMMLDLDQGWEKINQERFEKMLKDREKQKEEEEKKEEDRVPGTNPSHPLKDYAGEYENPAYGVMAIQQHEEKLQGKFHSSDFTLEHWHFDVFKPSERMGMIGFQTNLKGDVDSLSVALEPTVSPIIFTKKVSEEMKDPKFLSQFTGEYEVSELIITVSLRGNILSASIPGQPTIELVPYKETEFTLKGLEDYSVRFVMDKGEVIEIIIKQPGGSFRGKKIK